MSRHIKTFIQIEKIVIDADSYMSSLVVVIRNYCGWNIRTEGNSNFALAPLIIIQSDNNSTSHEEIKEIIQSSMLIENINYYLQIC